MLPGMNTLLTKRIGTALLIAAMTASAGWSRTSFAAPSVPVSELLEKGIYTEETKGDLDGAISIYRELLVEAQKNETIAAQAAFRLGQCLLKKGRKEEAIEQFKKLIKEFPSQKELVAKAQEYLPGVPKLQPVPWGDGERLLMKIFLPNGDEAGVIEYRANLIQTGTQSLWQVGARMEAAGVSSVSCVEAQADSFRPISSYWKHSILGEVRALYGSGQVELRRKGNDSGKTTLPIACNVFDNEQAMHVMRRLPLNEGYKTTLPVFSSIAGMEVPVGLEVKGMETVETPAGKFPCQRVQLSIGQSFLFSQDAHRYLVEFEAGPAKAKLASISQRKIDEPVSFTDETLGVTLTAPPNWIISKHQVKDPLKEIWIDLFDADAVAEMSGLDLVPTESIKEKKSAKDWVQSDLKNRFTNRLGSVKVREGSWKDCAVSGRPGVSVVADCMLNGKARVLFEACAIGPKISERFQFSCAPENFEGMRKAFEGIIASYHRK